MKSLVILFSALIAVDPGRDHYVTDIDLGPECARHTDDQNRDGVQPCDEPLRKDPRGHVALTDDDNRHFPEHAIDAARLHEVPVMPPLPSISQKVAHRLAFQ
jgi:hypothetical protein